MNWNNKDINTTPFMEKISESKHATRLVNSYSTHRCSPSRAALLSGIYPFRYGLGKAAIKSQYLPIGIDPELELLPRKGFVSRPRIWPKFGFYDS